MSGCGKTSVGGWHCEGTGCRDGGAACLLNAAAPRTVLAQAEAEVRLMRRVVDRALLDLLAERGA